MTTTTRKLLKWEMCWIPVEMAMIAFGLYLLLCRHLDEAEACFLFLTVGLSCVVRLRHYLQKQNQ